MGPGSGAVGEGIHPSPNRALKGRYIPEKIPKPRSSQGTPTHTPSPTTTGVTRTDSLPLFLHPVQTPVSRLGYSVSDV